MKHAMFELIEEVSKARGGNKKVAKLKEIDPQYIKILLDITYNPNFKWLIPEGAPTYNEADDNYSVLKTRFYSELMKIGTYLNVGQYPNMNQIKRENLFRTTLERIHPEDAKLLIYIKDKRELPGNIPMKVIQEVFPALSSKWVIK